MIGDSSRGRSLVGFLNRTRELKRTARTGWLDRGVPAAQAESVAEHAFQTALLAWVAAANDPTLDRDRILKLALIHDLPEAIIGDAPPYERDKIPDSGADRAAWRAFLDRRHIRSAENRQVKRAAESEAIVQLISELQGNARIELAALWHELREGLTMEARFVKQADVLEAYLQSLAYQQEDASLPVASFAAEVAEVVTHPALVMIRDAARDAS